MTATEGQPKPIDKIKIDQLEVEIHATRKDLGVAAARTMAAKMVEVLGQKERVRVVFASAPSQNEFLGALREDAGIPWDRISIFHMDEYLGVDENTPGGFRRYMREHLIDAVKPNKFYGCPGDADDLDVAMAEYAAAIQDDVLSVL